MTPEQAQAKARDLIAQILDFSESPFDSENIITAALLSAERDGYRRGVQAMEKRGIYVASKTKHAAAWRHYRRQGFPIIATWIDEAGAGETKSHEDLAIRCIDEAKRAEVVFLYCEPGELHKGSLIEVGAALASGVPVYCAGECESLSKTFVKHPLWKAAANPAAFFYMFRHLRTCGLDAAKGGE